MIEVQVVKDAERGGSAQMIVIAKDGEAMVFCDDGFSAGQAKAIARRIDVEAITGWRTARRQLLAALKG